MPRVVAARPICDAHVLVDVALDHGDGTINRAAWACEGLHAGE